MDIQQQMMLGFDRMKAAIIGGHPIFPAWIEVIDLTGGGARPQVLNGALTCLFSCVEGVARAGLLPTFRDSYFNAFVCAGSKGRLLAISRAVGDDEWLAVAGMVALMIECIAPHRSRIEFDGFVATVV